MADLQPPDPPLSLSAEPPPISTTALPSAAPPPPPLPPPTDNLLTSTAIPPAAAAAAVASTSNLGAGPSLAPKRQRRPSVRLGEIGDQSYDQSHSHHPRRPKTWRFHKDPSLAAKTSKTRPLTNLVNGGDAYHHPEALHHNDDIGNYSYDFGSKKPKTKRPAKRVRSNWASAAAKFKSSANGAAGMLENDTVFRDIENLDTNISNDEFRDFEAEEEGSESPIKEQLSPVHSMDNQTMGLQFWDRRAMRARLSNSESLDHRQDTNNKNLNFNNTINGIHNEMNSGDENRSISGVRDWLIGLGLGRYAPVFEIHEVDDEVLPMLTLEDLKDMGINAVGSRRKMYSAILKLRKGLS